jgi:predicted transcriptional regulator
MSAQNRVKGLLVESITEPCGLLCCAFGVNNSVAKVYFELEDNPLTVEEIAKKVGKERSVVQRYLQDLVRDEVNLAIRETVPLPQGGYHYVYRKNSSEAIRQEMLDQLDKWYSETRKYLLETWPEPAR